MFHQTKLDNGLTVIAEIRNEAVSSAAGFFVQTGARDEPHELSGVSHFLEHMMFKGTESRTALEISYELSRLGAQANAFTSEESTVYYFASLPEYFTEILALLADMMRSTLDQREFDTEKGVILEEIALYQDRPTHILFESALRYYFGSHPAGNSVLGTTESVRAITREGMLRYFHSRYAPGNMILAGSGRLDWNEFVDSAAKLCGTWKGTDDRSFARVYPEHFPKNLSTVLTRDNLTRSHVCILGPGPDARDSSIYATHLLGCVLGDVSGSRAYWELVDKGIADSASIHVDDMDHTGVVYTYASTDPDRIDTVTDTLLKILDGSTEVSSDELQRALTKYVTRLVLQGESPMRRLMSIGLGWMQRGDYLSLDDEMSHYKSVTLEDLRSVADRFLKSDRAVVQMIPSSL